VVPNVPVEVRFSCATLTVPLDHGLLPGPPGQGRLALRVAMADNVDAPRGVLFWLVAGRASPGWRWRPTSPAASTRPCCATTDWCS
jgi:hypothetical protein